MPTLRAAVAGDLDLLARMNRHLIEDEGSRNPMSLPELRERLRGWLDGAEWEVVVFERGGTVVGYAVYQLRPDSFDAARQGVYLRQMFIEREQRRRGLGRAALDVLLGTFPVGAEVTLDVLATNPGGAAFWRGVGFAPYLLTLKRQL